MERVPTDVDLSRIETVQQLVAEFAPKLRAVKAASAPADFPWYSYDTFANVWHLERILTGENRRLFQDIRGKKIADIGGADGDMAYFCEHIGCAVDIIDNPPTNGNHLNGAAILKKATGSAVNILPMDLDEYFDLPGKYDFAFFMGILYHLQNPYYVMSKLARNVRRITMSTKLASFPAPAYGDGREGYGDVPVAYLLDQREANGDPTNYWVFTDACMRRLIDRTGWTILDYQAYRNQDRTDPVTVDGDERVFCYLESRTFQP